MHAATAARAAAAADDVVEDGAAAGRRGPYDDEDQWQHRKQRLVPASRMLSSFVDVHKAFVDKILRGLNLGIPRTRSR